MNKLTLLMEEKESISKCKDSLEAGMKYLNPMRDSEYYGRMDEFIKTIKCRMNFLDKEIEETKRSFNGIEETELMEGHVMIGRRKSDGKDLFLRYVFIPERVVGNNWNNAFIFDWVENLEMSCFIDLSTISASNKPFTIELFREVYKFHKDKISKEATDIKLKGCDLSTTMNFTFKD